MKIGSEGISKSRLFFHNSSIFSNNFNISHYLIESSVQRYKASMLILGTETVDLSLWEISLCAKTLTEYHILDWINLLLKEYSILEVFLGKFVLVGTLLIPITCPRDFVCNTIL